MIAPMLNLSIRNTPTGDMLTCKGWVQEAALRMLLNNLNPEVAERPEELIVYGGRGKAAGRYPRSSARAVGSRWIYHLQ